MQGDGRAAQWHEHDGECALVEWLDEPPQRGYVGFSGFDLSASPGIKVFAWNDGDGSRLLIQAHHACSDGLGAVLFLEDLLVAYASELDATDGTSPRRIDASLLAGRGRFWMTAGKLLAFLPRQLIGLKGIAQFAARRPAPLLGFDQELTDQSCPADFPAAVSTTFTRDETRAILSRARDQGITVNDLLLGEILQALQNFRDQQGLDGDEWLRIAVPMSLREPEDAAQPATNLVSMVFLDRRKRVIRDFPKLLKTIYAETQQIKRNHLRFTFVLWLIVARRLMGSLAGQVKSTECNATCVVTNVGVISMPQLANGDGKPVAADLRLVSVDVLGSIAAAHPGDVWHRDGLADA